MSIHIENETDITINKEQVLLIEKAISESAKYVHCAYPIEVSITFVEDETIKELNRDHRNIDHVTDVLSFPLIDFEELGNLSEIGPEDYDYFNLDTHDLILGDIVISLNKVKEQAAQYGHSCERELGFLIVHSMLHLFGYDHMGEEDAEEMFRIQDFILEQIGLKR